MSLLAQVKSGRQVRPRRTLVHAFGGVGKSTFGAASVAPIFLPTEEGVDDIDCDKLPLCTSYDEAMQAITELYQEEHNYKTLVVDTLDWFERLLWKKLCEQRGVKTIEDIGWSKGYEFAMPLWQQLIQGFDALRNQKSMAIVLLAHTKVVPFKDPELGPYDRYEPALHKLASAYVRDWCDEVLFANYKVYTASQGEGPTAKQRGIGTGERVMKTTEKPSHVAKNRLGLPDEMPFTFAAYSEHFPQ
jgi:hypothetical protein